VGKEAITRALNDSYDNSQQPAIMLSAIDSTRNWRQDVIGLAPMAMRTPISRVRSVTTPARCS